MSIIRDATFTVKMACSTATIFASLKNDQKV